MIKTRVAVAALMTAVLSLFVVSAAHAEYAPPPFTADAPDNVEPGGEFTVTFDSGDINCAWALVPFNGQTAPADTGSTYTVTLTAPEEDGTYTITANCTWDPEGASVDPASAPAADATTVTPAVFSQAAPAASDTLLAVPQTDPVSVQIVVGDGGDDAVGDDDAAEDGGILPNTGGSNATLLALGAGLVVVGAGVTVAARRRKTA